MKTALMLNESLLTVSDTNSLINKHKKYIDGGIESWRKAMAIINANFVYDEEGNAIDKLTTEQIQSKLNNYLTEEERKEVISLL